MSVGDGGLGSALTSPTALTECPMDSALLNKPVLLDLPVAALTTHETDMV